jgi:hypothetical protein
VFSCFNQDQPSDTLDWAALNQQLRQNSVQEKLTAEWSDHCLMKLGKRDECRKALWSIIDLCPNSKVVEDAQRLLLRLERRPHLHPLEKGRVELARARHYARNALWTNALASFKRAGGRPESVELDARDHAHVAHVDHAVAAQAEPLFEVGRKVAGALEQLFFFEHVETRQRRGTREWMS